MIKEIILDNGRRIGEGNPTFIVANAGINHNGSLQTAKKLIDMAVECGADAVEFQKSSVHHLLSHDAFNAPCDEPCAQGGTYGEYRLSLELSGECYRELLNHSQQQRIAFCASVSDVESAEFMRELGATLFKISSADITNPLLLKHIVRFRKPIMISTGMSELSEVAEAVIATRRINEAIVLLHCVSTYPNEFDDINLQVMQTLRKHFGLPVGYSGHERGIAVSTAAVALGACVIERHVTLDRTMHGPGHPAALERTDLEKLVYNIRSLEQSFGDGKKRITPAERELRKKLGKSVVSTCNIPSGTVITPDMLTVKCPGTGLSPKLIYTLPGKKAATDIKQDTVIRKEDIVW